MASDLKRKADSKEETGPTKKKRSIKRISTEGGGWKSIAVRAKIGPKKKTTGLFAAKSESIGFTAGGGISNISGKAEIDVAMSLISSGGRDGGRIGNIVARAELDGMKKSLISSGGRKCIAARVKVDPREMMKPGIRDNLVKRAVNCVLRTMISRPRSNPVQRHRHRRMNFESTRSRFCPDFTSAPPLVADESGNEDLVRDAVSGLTKARVSTSTCSEFKPTTIRTPVRTPSGCLFTDSQSVIISS